MLLYLDNSVLNRPFDDQRQARIWLETLSFSLVLSLIESGEAWMTRSLAHQIENGRNPFQLRKAWVERCLSLANTEIHLDEKIELRARSLEHDGLGPMDALHVAFAETGRVDRFLTCDDRLVRRYSGVMRIQNPLTFISTLDSK
jgi:predicted nucleic acid-binding protein